MKYAVKIGLAALGIVIESAAYAGMTAGKGIVLDFRDRETVAKQARWCDPEHFRVTKDGLRLALNPRDELTSEQIHSIRRDLWIETTEPMAIGWSWRPVEDCSITAEKIPAGEFRSVEGVVIFPSSAFYVRYSPDAVHWSTWQQVEAVKPESVENAKQIFKGSISIPHKEQEEYRAKVREYSRLDVPWGSDEEAAVKWILGGDPGFFARHLPFMGYLQFLYEQSLLGDERIERLEIHLWYGAGGLHTSPKVPIKWEERDGPWRFKGAGSATAESQGE